MIVETINTAYAKALSRIAELEADANAVVHLHALAIEVGNLPDGDESVYDFLQRIITTGSPASIRARSDALRARIAELEAALREAEAFIEHIDTDDARHINSVIRNAIRARPAP